MPSTLRLSLSSKSSEIRAFLDSHSAWLRSCFGDDIGSLVQLRFDDSLVSLAAHQVLGEGCITSISPHSLETLHRLLLRVELPPGVTPAATLHKVSRPRTTQRWRANWLDAPVALHFTGLGGPVVAANIPTVDAMSQGSSWREVVLIRQADAPALLRLMENAFADNRMMTVIGGNDVRIQPLAWQDLVLEDSVVRLVQDDFQLFLRREEWLRQHRLPFRRGYLFHGPPGNGKSSVIRAMLSTPGISGFTLDPFLTNVREDILAMMFAEAAESTPAVIVLEDLDRCYPLDKEKDPEAKISLQQLLNHIDGVGSQDGIVVVATANKPSILDPALLRRPGRFDRVVGFHNPSAELRERYIRKMHGQLETQDLRNFIESTDGFSFAQVRECYILAGQFALGDDKAIDSELLTRAASTLSETMELADHRWKSKSGFH